MCTSVLRLVAEYADVSDFPASKAHPCVCIQSPSWHSHPDLVSCARLSSSVHKTTIVVFVCAEDDGEVSFLLPCVCYVVPDICRSFVALGARHLDDDRRNRGGHKRYKDETTTQPG